MAKLIFVLALMVSLASAQVIETIVWSGVSLSTRLWNWGQAALALERQALGTSGDETSVPKSVLKVKVWYDIGFLRSNQTGTHAKAKEFIHASFGHVQHFMCSSLLGTQLETKVSFISLNLTYPEVFKISNFFIL